ncbi:type II toxin-antitoxin system death-on-curing family toxin [Microbacterium sp. HA-8]|uniref:type II toxin-antitoxin system death-on-curing family toxin n=1 Tax=Microbacterium sp. HA-8 TaxID=3234200 RepID=UPI0038F661DB
MTAALTIADAEVAFESAQLLLTTEPMPALHTRAPHRLEAVLAAPFASFDGREQYPSLEEKAAVLFYAACKDHPFQNGNKRMAVVLTNTFLMLNGAELDTDALTLYDVAYEVTETMSDRRPEALTYLTRFVQENVRALDVGDIHEPLAA